MRTPEYEINFRDGRDQITIRSRGRAVLANSMTNRGTAFTPSERRDLQLTGLLPGGDGNIEEQTARTYEQYLETETMLQRNRFLATLRDSNEILFYRLLSEHVEEMLPVVYTPTIGEAIERYSNDYARPRGIFLSIDRPDEMEESLRNHGLGPDDVDLIVVTDSEGILGIGDQGVGGIQIAVGKLSVYTAAAGLHPRRVIPIVLDTGTDNQQLLNNPFYVGDRHPRVRGERYDAFIQQFLETASRVYPKAMIHWEDFGAGNAHRILEKYRDDYCTFNDDIQGTAAVALAALLAAVRASGVPLERHRIVVYGAGTAGIGIADLLRQKMVAAGVEGEGFEAIYAMGSRGLIIEDSDGVRDFQLPYARTRAEVDTWDVADPNRITLGEVVRSAHPTILIGTSTQGGAFTESIVKEMASKCQRPIIMPLSNPTSRAEATPQDLITWTDGAALVATGSPFAPVEHGGVTHHIAQANNALIFPGLGLGVAVCAARRVTEGMIEASATALAGLVDSNTVGASLLPSMGHLREVSAAVGAAVVAAAQAEGVAGSPVEDPTSAVEQRMWTPSYPEILIE